MPIRSRLRNPGLKLKIPSRSLVGGGGSFVNSFGGGTSPYGRHSASPKASHGIGGRPPRWSSSSPSGAGLSTRRRLPPQLYGCRRTVSFAAEPTTIGAQQQQHMDIDNRPAVATGVPQACPEQMPDLGRCRRDSVIPIQIVRDQRPTFNVMFRTSCSQLEAMQSHRTENERFDGDSEPESPVIEVDLTPSPPPQPPLPPSGCRPASPFPGMLSGLPALFHYNHHHHHHQPGTARHLYDWLAKLSPRLPPALAHHTTTTSTGYRSIPILRTNQQRSPASSLVTSSDGSILTPTDPCGGIAESSLLHLGSAGGAGGSSNALANSRRDSSGALQSPDVMDPAKEDGFYLLKKDSQRRATLVRVLQQDKHNICKIWHSLLIKDIPDPCLSELHLSTLMDGLRGYIPEQNREPLEAALAQLREDLDYDGAKINQLQLALYNFQDAVNSVLRLHSIKPHWMFALDNLVRAAVQAAILVLSPELGAHLADPGLGGEDAGGVGGGGGVLVEHDQGSTSGVSTVNSGFHQAGGMGAGGGGGGGGGSSLLSSLSRLREENRQLLTDLVEAQHSYQELLRQSLEEQKLHLQLLSQSLAASSLVAHQQLPSLGMTSQAMADRQNNNSELDRSAASDAAISGRPVDPALVAWLHDLGLNGVEVMSRLCAEDLTLTDLLELMGRDDLRRLGLKAGPELRIWRAILQHRGLPPSLPYTP